MNTVTDVAPAQLDRQGDMIRLSGRSEEEVRVVFTGLRPGEKLYEEVLADSEHTRATHHPKLRIARAQSVEDGWLDALLLWLRERLLPREPRDEPEREEPLREDRCDDRSSC